MCILEFAVKLEKVLEQWHSHVYLCMSHLDIFMYTVAQFKLSFYNNIYNNIHFHSAGTLTPVICLLMLGYYIKIRIFR